MQTTCWTLINVVALLSIPSVTVAVTVELGHNTTISCRLNCSTVEWWTKNVQPLRIFQFADGKCDIIPEFEDRIECSPEKIRRGDVSLSIQSVVFNDQGWYYCSCDGKDQCDRRIEVIVPASLNVSVGGRCKIPCYAETEKRTPDSSVYVLWEKDGQRVAKLERGKIVYGSGFDDRVVLSVKDFRKGDLSLIVSDARYSDSGLYRCSLKDEEYGYPNSVALSVHAHVFEHYKKEGDSALLNLVMPQLVMVFLTRVDEGATENWICTTTKTAVQCKAGYDHRASIINASMMMSELTVADSGLYTIKNTNSEVIAFNRLVVIGLPSAKFRASFVYCGFFGIVLVSLAVWICIRKRKQRKQQQEKAGEKPKLTRSDENVHLSIQQSESSCRPSIPMIGNRKEEYELSPIRVTAGHDVQDELMQELD